MTPFAAAEARTVAIQLLGGVGGTTVTLPAQVILSDGVCTTVIIAGVPVLICDGGVINATININFQHANCNVTIQVGGSGVRTLPTTQFPISGNQNQTCSGAGGYGGGGGSTDTPINATVTITDITGTNTGTLHTRTGQVTFNRTDGQQNTQPGQTVPPGTLVTTGPDGNTSFTQNDGSVTSLSPNTRAAVGENNATLVGGTINRLSNQQSAHETITPVGRVRGIGTEYSTTYSQINLDGRAVINVRTGSAETTDRRNITSTALAGQSITREDLVPRVTLLIPTDQGTVRSGQQNTFTWTSFPGAQNYLIEFNVNPSGFAVANATAVENPVFTLRLPLGSFTEGSGVVTFSFTVPTGVVPIGSVVRYRIFPANNSGQVLPNTTSSDPARITVN
ncbi:MAG TPA: hypothetical protein VML54_12360 [Candidatus Limnocylindrales bacterium]|nr:hypothetical protein [Candidatus Limnocylindrales bacterium]